MEEEKQRKEEVNKEKDFEIKYDVPFEVTRNQYIKLMDVCAGIVAGREDEKTKKFYIVVWSMKYVEMVKSVLKNVK